MDQKNLAYRLRKPARYCEWNGLPVLVLSFPLKFVSLHPYWKPVFESAADGGFIPFESILSRVNIGSESAEIFLNSLVRKGFLEQEGYPVISHYPFISIIIPVRNRPEEIAACLESLGRLEYPADRMEVIVVDDASDDNTREVVSTFPVRLIALEKQEGASSCRNIAARQARGEILAFLDSDCLADPFWLNELIPAFNDRANGAAGGIVDSFFNEKGLDRYEKVKSSLNMGLRSRSTRDGNRFFYLPSCNLLVRKAPFLELGGFNEDLTVGEDVDLCWRLQDRGHHFEYRPVGRVYHRHRNKMRQFGLRRFDYGTSEPLLQQTHSSRVKEIMMPPSGVLFWCLMLLAVAARWMPLLGIGGLILLSDALSRFYKLNKKNFPINFSTTFIAAFRGYLVLFYYWASFVSRYYLVFVPFLFLLTPTLGAIVLAMHLLTGVGEYCIKKPLLSLPSFILYFTIEQLSYQLGVWWGCFKRFYFGPVVPRVVRKPSA